MFYLGALFGIVAVALMLVVLIGILREERNSRGHQVRTPPPDLIASPLQESPQVVQGGILAEATVEGEPEEESSGSVRPPPARARSYATRQSPLPAIRLGFWDHMLPVFERTAIWTKDGRKFARPRSHDDLARRLHEMLKAERIIEAPVYAYFAQFPGLPPHRILARNYNASRQPAQIFRRSGEHDFPNGKTIVELSGHLQHYFGLRIGVLGQLMSPTIQLLRELHACDVSYVIGEDARSDRDVVVMPYSRTDDQILALLDGVVDLIQAVYPATVSLAEDETVKLVPLLDRRPPVESIEGDVANLLICDEGVLGDERLDEIVRFVAVRNAQLKALADEELASGDPHSSPSRPDGGRQLTRTMADEPLTLGASLEFVTDLTFGEHQRAELLEALERQLASARKKQPGVFPEVDWSSLEHLVVV